MPDLTGQQKKQQIFYDLLLRVPLCWAAVIQFFHGGSGNTFSCYPLDCRFAKAARTVNCGRRPLSKPLIGLVGFAVYSSTVKTSSIEALNTFAIFHAKTNDGLYFPFSRFPIVSLRTPTSFAKSSCFMPYFALYSFIRFLIIACPFSLLRFQNNKSCGKCKNSNCKA